MVARDVATKATLRLGCGRAAQFGGGASQAEQAGGLRKPLLLRGLAAWRGAWTATADGRWVLGRGARARQWARSLERERQRRLFRFRA